MKYRKKEYIKQIRVGAVILIALSIIVISVFFLEGNKKIFGDKVKYKIMFSSTGGLYNGDPVLLTGVEVGNVVHIGFPEEIEKKKIVVEISISKEVKGRIRKDTRARIASASLVYGKVVELTMGSIEEPIIPPGSFIPADEGGSYSAIVDSTNLMVDEIRQFISKINRGKGAIGLLLNEEMQIRRTLRNLSEASFRLNSLLNKIERGEGPVGTLLSDSTDLSTTVENIRNTVSDINQITENLKGKESIIGKLLNDTEYGDTIMKDLKEAIHSISNIAAKIDRGEGTLGSLINDKEVYYGLRDVILGVQSSRIAKWLINNRRKAGERERLKREKKKKKD